MLCVIKNNTLQAMDFLLHVLYKVSKYMQGRLRILANQSYIFPVFSKIAKLYANLFVQIKPL